MRFQGRFQLDDLASSGLASPGSSSTVSHPCLGSTAPAPGSAHGPGCPGRIVVRRAALVRALSPGRACPRGLAAWWAGRPVGPDIRGPGIRKGRRFEGLEFLEAVAVHHYY